MANKIDGLPAASTPPASGDLVWLEQSGLPKKVSILQLGVLIGSGTPESNVTAPVSTLFLRTDGGAGTTLYVKESGTGDTGWVAK